MSKYEEALKNLSCDVSKLCKEMGWEMDSKDIEIMKELIKEKSDLEAKLAEKDKAIENWQTMYESVMQTCHNDKEEIERLNKRLALSEKQCELMAQHIREDLKCDYDEDEIYDYFKEQAKEMMKSE